MYFTQHFEDLPLSSEILRSIKELEFEQLFPIQAQAIIPLLEGKDHSAKRGLERERPQRLVYPCLRR